MIEALRKLGFEGPYSGGKHQFMVRGDSNIRIPHRSDIGAGLLARILRQPHITRDEWESV